ncbi:hypothetical protein QYE76_038027 [Lolium multiflorum]|uniref:CCHC-type domain-containing protein n=1 Tax=Lolium multiflorum TaxID=4521 RepID=A0AAD8WQV3_LOLMU|nr:hypothetical protein QYE76_038027 [Lolium multiflorum]
MSERELPPPPSAPRSFQAGAATPNPSAAPAASPAFLQPLVSPGSAPVLAGLDLLFGSLSPEILAGSAEQALRRLNCSARRPGPASPSMAPAPRAGCASPPSHQASSAADVGLGADVAACAEFLPPPPPLKPGDKPRTAASLEARSISLHAQVSPRGARLRSIIVAPNRAEEELRQRIPQDPQGKWQIVRPKFWWRKINPSFPRAARAAPMQRSSRGELASESDPFKGRCFRCLSALHFVRDCKDTVRCLDCKKPGHRARDCLSKRSAAAGATSATQPLPPAPPRQPQASAAAMPSPRRRLGTELEPGHPSTRPGEVYSSSLSTPEMEAAATDMRRTHLAILVSDPRLNISTRSIAKALQEELKFPLEDIHVLASFPDDFLARFDQPWQRDMALERGTILLRRGSFALTTWSPTTRGRPQTWRFYCRLTVESLPLNAWDDVPTIKAVLGGACELDKIERRSTRRDNTAALFVWVWCLDPDLIPKVKPHSILNRPAERRQDLPEGAPAEEGRDSLLYRILIHLDKVVDYSPIDEGRRRRGVLWPQVYRKDWHFGVEDGMPGPRTRPVRDRLGPSSHSQRRDDDRDDARDARRGGSRRGDRRDGDAAGLAGGSRRSAERCHNHHDDYDRRHSRSPDRRRRGDTTRHRSRSAGAADARVEVTEDQQADQAAAPSPPRASNRRSRSRSRTPTDSRAWGCTPSPPPGFLAYPAAVSLPSPPMVDFGASDALRCGVRAASPVGLVHFTTSIPPPPSPLIPWEELPGPQPGLGCGGLEDRWSANIADVQADDTRTYYPLSPPHLRSPLHMPPEHQAVDHWAAFFGEQSAEFVPNITSIQAWQELWQEDPTPPADQPPSDLLQPRLAMEDGTPGGWGSRSRDSLTGSEKLLAAAHSGQALATPTSPGWQLQDIFSTPPARPALPQLSDSSSEDLDDATLCEVTPKSNALRALRDANHVGHGLMEGITKGVGQLHVDPKTSLMSKLLGMISPSLLGFPTNSKPKKKRTTPRHLLCMDTAIRRSERPATKSSTMLASRRAQASACKQLGLIQREDEFDDAVQAQYLRLFQRPLTQDSLQGLALLADAAHRPGFVLPEQDLHELLREAPTEV